jgi:hypothetical protein
VNEAYLRLVNIRRVQWKDRAHFLAAGPESCAAFSSITRGHGSECPEPSSLRHWRLRRN